MRVLLVHDWVAGEGGAERVMLDARRLLEAAGHRCELLVSSAGTMADGTAEHVAVGAHSLPAATKSGVGDAARMKLADGAATGIGRLTASMPSSRSQRDIQRLHPATASRRRSARPMSA